MTFNEQLRMTNDYYYQKALGKNELFETSEWRRDKIIFGIKKKISVLEIIFRLDDSKYWGSSIFSPVSAQIP